MRYLAGFFATCGGGRFWIPDLVGFLETGGGGRFGAAAGAGANYTGTFFIHESK